jgi:dephospho-CoA kinase
MLKVGITGGIGSGKSLVARMFQVLGIPVLNADEAAKYLMQHDAALMGSLRQLFGNEVYQNGRLNRPFLASVVFADKAKLEQLNSLVHPAVLRYGKTWAEEQNTPYVLKEAAIFFESGSYKEMDKMIGVYAPFELRLERAMQRDNATEETVRQRMAQQMDEDEKMKRCDYIIRNDGSTSVIEQVLALHKVFTGTM